MKNQTSKLETARAPQFLVIAALILIVAGGAGAMVLYSCWRDLPNLEQIRAVASNADGRTSIVLDRRGEIISRFSEERREPVFLAQLPTHVIDAFVSAEDAGFWQHHGVALSALTRAAFINARRGAMVQGASTITQQVARICFLDQRKSIRRKLVELLLAFKLERALSKQEILELYMNRVFLGRNSYGVQAAAQSYFGKGAQDLSVAEAALLAGLLKAPSRYAPHIQAHRDKARARQNYVLTRMYADGKLSKKDFDHALNEHVRVVKDKWQEQRRAFGFLVDRVRNESRSMLELADLPKRGLRIRTGVSASMQQKFAALFGGGLPEFEAAIGDEGNAPSHDHIEVAALAIDNRTGDILALQGSRNFGLSQFDRVQSMRRPMGSLIVPAVVALALRQGFELTSCVSSNEKSNPGGEGLDLNRDVYDVYKDMEANNGEDEDADGENKPLRAHLPPPPCRTGKNKNGNLEQRSLTLAHALAERSMLGDKLVEAVGIGTIEDFFSKAGLGAGRDSLEETLLSPMEAARLFAFISNGGEKIRPRFVKGLDDLQSDEAIYESRSAKSEGQTKDKVNKADEDGFFSHDEGLVLRLALGGLNRSGANKTHMHGEFALFPAACPRLDCAWGIVMSDRATLVVWLGSEYGHLKIGQNKEDAEIAVSKLSQKILKVLAPADRALFFETGGEQLEAVARAKLSYGVIRFENPAVAEGVVPLPVPVRKF